MLALEASEGILELGEDIGADPLHRGCSLREKYPRSHVVYMSEAELKIPVEDLPLPV